MGIFDDIYGFGGDLQRQFQATLDQARVPLGPAFDAKRAVLRQEAEARQRQAEVERLEAARAREQNQAIISGLDYSVPFAAPGSVEEAIARAQVDNRPPYLSDPSRVTPTSLFDEMREREAEERKQPTINFADLDSSGIRAAEAARLAAQNENSNDFMTPIPFAPSATDIANSEMGVLEAAQRAGDQARIASGMDYGLQTGQVLSSAAASPPSPVRRPTGFSAPFKDVFVEPSTSGGRQVNLGGGQVTSGGGPAPSTQATASARVIVPQTRDEQLEAYENFGKNIPGTIDIGAQSFKIAGPSDIGQRATVPIPGTSATGAEGIASEVTRRLGLAPAAAPAAAAPAQDGGGFFSNLLKGGIFDSESPLSRQQRVMLGVAALKDAGSALEGKPTNFFGETQQGFQQARQGASDRQFKFLQQARLARESAMAYRSKIKPFSTESERQSAERTAREFDKLAELSMAQAGFGFQQATAAAAPSVATPAATSAAPAVAGAPTQGAPAASDRDRVIGLAKQALAGQIPSNREDREAAQKFISQNAGSSFLSFEQANEASKKFAEYDSAVMRTDGELRTLSREIEKIDQAISRTPGGAGFFSLIDFIPETDAAELAAFVESIQSNIAFSALQKMRELSPTGGALGNVSNEELRALQNSIQSLKTNMSPETLEMSLRKIKEDYKTTIRKIYVTNDGGYNQEAIDAFGEAPPWLKNEMNKPRDETEFGVGSNSGSGGTGPLLGVEPVSQ